MLPVADSRFIAWRPEVYMKTKLGHLLDIKGHDVWSIGPDATVYQAIETMAERGIGLLLVIERDRPVGVISERDYARKVILAGRSSREMRVDEIMTRKIVYGRPEQTVQEALAVMTRNHFRHLPVIEGDRVLGMLSIGDLVRVVIDDHQFRIDQLEGYISS
jgi:CBS domain-containing protein